MRSEPPVRLRGGRILDSASGTDRVGDLAIAGGIVRGIDLPPLPDERVIDVEGCWVVPGFTDIHTHLREPGQPHKETIRSGTLAAAAGGFTTVCSMANTDPVIDAPDRLDWVIREAAAVGVVRVMPLAAVTRGLEGRELAPHAQLAQAGACAFSDDGMPIRDPAVFASALRSVASLGSTISVHAEDTSYGEPGIDDRVAPSLGCSGIGPDAETDLIAAHLEVLAGVPGARMHVAHLTTAAGVAMIRDAKQAGLAVTAEVTPHHLSFTYEQLQRSRFGLSGDPFAKVNPPLRSEADRAALLAGLGDGTIDAIATDHAPHAIMEKAISLSGAPSGLSGLELVLPTVCALIRAGLLDLDRAVDALTHSAARCFGLPSPGLRPGAIADVTVVDPEADWFVSGATLRSKGLNTPHLGTDVRGQARLVLHRGTLVHALGGLR